MATIYSKAESVCLWLGDGTKASDTAMEYFLHAGFQDLLVKTRDFGYEVPKGRYFVWKAVWMTYRRRVRDIATLGRGESLKSGHSTW
jgi:hypothetical protein